jgi:hypothetical protein
VELDGEPSGGRQWRVERARGEREMGDESSLLGHARTVRTSPRGAVATSGVR